MDDLERSKRLERAVWEVGLLSSLGGNVKIECYKPRRPGKVVTVGVNLYRTIDAPVPPQFLNALIPESRIQEVGIKLDSMLAALNEANESTRGFDELTLRYYICTGVREGLTPAQIFATLPIDDVPTVLSSQQILDGRGVLLDWGFL